MERISKRGINMKVSKLTGQVRVAELERIVLESSYSLYDSSFFSNIGTILLYAVVVQPIFPNDAIHLFVSLPNQIQLLTK
ncbi:sodium/hydrogen exchanger 2-like [Tropilaelaps mercedesae]|uniref:Sodium/hydrogen exchanger 2-like n=1 Tax=Tropilaelaps mercedesae TaxID=418985 RepID=A0A1V9XJB7_9ACAR|nr:sodium/hydrogen exchanger 2-like [Tropilaelaps mercedesae]